MTDKICFSISDTTIYDVFNDEEISRKLLIIGEPGSGKTTTLLELAASLLKSASTELTEPISVLLNLASWKNPRQPIFEWTLAELNNKYGVSRNLAKTWIEKSQILPLLDGLDEVAPEKQKDCVKAINDWLIGDIEQQPCGLIVCCRLKEWEEIAQASLSLNGAILLQPVSESQIQSYFQQLELADAWILFQQDISLNELLSKPLFLSIVGLLQSQGKFSLSDWQILESSEQQVEYLLEMYWKISMERELILDPQQRQAGIISKTYGKTNPPNYLTVQRALSFLAKNLEKESSPDLLIEKIQPSWLLTKQQRLTYHAIFILLTVCLGFLLGFLTGSFIVIKINFEFGFQFIILLGLFVGLFCGLGSLIIGIFWSLLGITSEIDVASKNFFSLSNNTKKKIAFSIFILIISGIVGGVIGSLINRDLGGFVGCLTCVLIANLITQLTNAVVHRVEYNIASSSDFLIVNNYVLYIYSFRSLFFVLIEYITTYFNELFWGLKKLVKIRYLLSESLTFLRKLTLFKIFAFLFYCCVFLVMVLVYGWIWILAGLSILFTLDTIMELVRNDIAICVQPNQGIKNALKNAFLLCFISTIAGLLLESFLLSFFDVFSTFNKSLEMFNIFLIVHIFLTFCLSGGESFYFHIVLRITLCLYNYVPFRYDRLLNYCTERRLIQRIGGRYRFLNRLLQGHFAKMDLD